MHVGHIRALLHVERARHAVVRVDLSPRRGAGHEQLAAADLHVLRGIAIAIHHRASGLPGRLVEHLAHARHQLQTREGLALVEQLLVGEVVQPIPLPVLRLVLAPMPAHQMREQPTRVLRVRGVAGLGRQPREQRFARGVLLLFELADLLGRLWRFLLRTRHRRARRLHTGPQRLEPIPQRFGRSAVVAVVATYRVTRLKRNRVWRPALERQLDGLQMLARIAERHLAPEAVELLELLD